MEGPQQKPIYRDPKILVFVALLIAIALSLFFSGRKTAGSKSAGSARSRNHQTAQNTAGDPVLSVANLNKVPPEVQNVKRNLFTFYEPPPPPPPDPGIESTPPEQPKAVCGDQVCQEGEDNQNCPTDCQPPPPPDIQLKYIGYLSENNGPVAFLTDGKEVYMGRENEIIANKYKVIKITGESVELGYLDLNQSRSIPFQGS